MNLTPLKLIVFWII